MLAIVAGLFEAGLLHASKVTHASYSLVKRPPDDSGGAFLAGGRRCTIKLR